MKFTEEGLTGKLWGNADTEAEAPEWESSVSQYFAKCQFNGIVAVIWRVNVDLGTPGSDFDGYGRVWIIQLEDLVGPSVPGEIDFVQAIIVGDIFPDIEYLLKLHAIYESTETGATITPVFTINGAPTTFGFYTTYLSIIHHSIPDGVLPTFNRPDTTVHITGLSNNWYSVGHNENIGIGPEDITYSWPKVGTSEGAFDIFDGRVEDTVIPPFTDVSPADALTEPTDNVAEVLVVPGLNLLHIHMADVGAFHFTYGLAVEIGDLGNNYQPSEILPVEAADISIFDDAPDAMPDTAIPATGDYRPTSFNFDSTDDFFPSPAPASPYPKPDPSGSATFASEFTGIDPNGQWDLYVVDSADGDVGIIHLGWDLHIITGSDDQTFDNVNSITIPEIGEGGDNPEADPYPSSITVAGMTGTVTDVRVVLNGLEHTFASDISVLLVSPTGESLIIMSACFSPP